MKRSRQRWLIWSAILLAGLLLMACQKDKPTEVDQQPPKVRVVYPRSNTSVSGVVIIRIEASDNEGIDRVEIYINDELKYTLQESPWEYSWETLILDNGTKHTIVAKAYDLSGNSTASAGVSVVVNNEINNPPTASIISPQDSTSFALGEDITFSGQGWDAAGHALREDQLSWFSDRAGYLGTGSSLAKNNLEAEWHTITLVATDDRNLVGEDSVAIYISTEAEQYQLTYDASDEEYPCWSPDATRIAYSSYQFGSQDIWIVSAAGGEPTQLTVGSGYNSSPSWHDAEIIFTSFRSGNADIWKMSESGGDAVAVTDHPGWDTSPCWSPDGQRMVISSQMAGGAQCLWVLPMNGGQALQLTTQPGYEPDWSVLGDIAYRSGDMNIYVTSLVGMTPIQVTWDPARDMSPSWSPDGDALAFTSDRGGNEDIWVMFFGEGRLRQLTFHSGRDYHPAWSPDGQWIAFSSDRSGNADIWLIRAP